MSLQKYPFTGSSKVTSCGFWQLRVRLSDLLEEGLTVLQEPTLTVLLVLPIFCFSCSEVERGRFFSQDIWGGGPFRKVSRTQKSGHIRPRQATEISNSKKVSPLDFFEVSSSGIFPFAPGFLCHLVRRSPKNLEKIVRFPGGQKSVKSCHISGCHGFFRFPVPRKSRRTPVVCVGEVLSAYTTPSTSCKTCLVGSGH